MIKKVNGISNYIMKKKSPNLRVKATFRFGSTNCKLHCGVCGVSFAGFSQHRSVLPDRNELRNPQRQLTSDRYMPA